MAELNVDNGGGGKHDKKRAKKQSTKVDMTPLVDLAFLLLTFFVLTATFSQPKTMRMIFPEKIKDPINEKAPEVKDGHTILATADNEVYYYRGQLEANTEMIKTDLTYKGLRKILVGANAKVMKALNELETKKQGFDEADTANINKIEREIEEAKSKDKVIVIIKNDDGATYKNMIDIIDELAISNIIYYYPSEDPFLPLEKKKIAEARAKAKAEGGSK